MRLLVGIALIVVLSGCLAGHAPPAAGSVPAEREARAPQGGNGGPPDGPSGGPATETTRHYNGTILLRSACGCLDSPHTGDPSAFCFGLPTNVTALRGVFTFSPPQQAGLEFHGPDAYKSSWDGNATDLLAQSPITLAYDHPEGGGWFVYGGPGIEGGGMQWSLDLTMVTMGTPSAEAAATFATTAAC